MRPCIYGLAVGDALGVPYEFCERGTFECTGMVGDGTHGQFAGTWSDDTSMALCICPSIKRLAYIDVADIAGRFRRWLEHGDFTCDGYAFDVGVTC
jgi:ADP-ribosylglycohydrolase